LSSDLKALVPLRWWLRSKLLSLLLSQLLSLSLQLLTSRVLLSLLLALPQPWPPLLRGSADLDKSPRTSAIAETFIAIITTAGRHDCG
jgi:hypothetical protein